MVRAGDHKALRSRGQMSAGRILLAAVAALCFWLGGVPPASAELYPARPIKIIVPTPAGGPVDVIARLVGNYLTSALAQAVVIDNRPGAGNTLGSKEAAQAEPDGYTLLYSSASGLVLAPWHKRRVPAPSSPERMDARPGCSNVLLPLI